jgi:hypothetical protein
LWLRIYNNNNNNNNNRYLTLEVFSTGNWDLRFVLENFSQENKGVKECDPF